MSRFEQFTLWKNSLLNRDPENGDNVNDQPRLSGFRKWFYWEPRNDSWAHEFFGSSVIHGLKYLSKRKLTVIERAFWIIAVISSLYASRYMIAQVWDRFRESPVIVTFNPTEEDTYRLPFPAVTICNKHLFARDKIMELIDQVSTGTDRHQSEAIEKLRMAHAICTSQQSFLREMRLVRPEEYPQWDVVNKPPAQNSLNRIIKFIYEYTQPCGELLRVCSWNNKKKNCSDLFKPIITDSGKCCVFNKLPNELMLFERDEYSGLEKRERGWSYEDIQEWDKWNYETGFIIEGTMKYPLRQKQAGSTYGLSVLVDPDVDNGYCQSQDSLGIRLLLHTPADTPRIAHMGTGFGLEKEVFIKIFPDLTVADESIADYDYEQRKCIFGKGSTLGPNQIDKPYTRNNCFLTCTQRHLRQNCNCTLYYTRRKSGYRICNPSINSPDFRCLRDVETKLAGNLRRHCSTCIYGCNFLKYSEEHSEASLLDPENLWGDNETSQPPPWSTHKLSIIHLFMGSDIQVAKLRQKLYREVDLIASIGGILGLLLGFSVLSAIEILYLLTIRLCCKRLRKSQLESDSPEAFLQLHLK